MAVSMLTAALRRTMSPLLNFYLYYSLHFWSFSGLGDSYFTAPLHSE